MFDRIEAGTYLIAAAVTEGNLKIKNIVPKIIQTEINILKKIDTKINIQKDEIHIVTNKKIKSINIKTAPYPRIQTEINILKKIGSKIKIKKDEIHIIGNKKIKSMKIKTAPYPGFPTDLQAQMMVLLCKANKSSIIEENIFENRFMHVAELNRMGGKILIKGNKAMVKGNINFAPAELMATDLRASVSLILAALTARGKSVINRIYHLDRGYENIEKKLRKVGAQIKRIN